MYYIFSRWIAYARKHMEHPYQWGVLIDLLHQLDELWVPDAFSRDEVRFYYNTLHTGKQLISFQIVKTQFITDSVSNFRCYVIAQVISFRCTYMKCPLNV